VPTDCAKVTCKEGETCKDGLCFSADGGAGGGSQTTGTGGGSTTSTSSGNGGSGVGGSGSGAGGAATTTDTSATGGGAGGAASQTKDVWGLATGGACKCTVPGDRGGRGADRYGLALAGLALGLAAARRARRGAGVRR
jgi:hypothetical protein